MAIEIACERAELCLEDGALLRLRYRLLRAETPPRFFVRIESRGRGMFRSEQTGALPDEAAALAFFRTVTEAAVTTHTLLALYDDFLLTLLESR